MSEDTVPMNEPPVLANTTRFLTLEAMPEPDKTIAQRTAGALAEKRINDCIRRRGTVLDLSGLGLSGVPPKIAQLEKLAELNLSKNRLSELPPEIHDLIHLTRLDLSHNPLGSLPPEIGRLVNLTLLDLSHTTLGTLPPEIGKLTGLTRLYLNNNCLSTLPPEIGNFPNLTRFYLSHNRLKSLQLDPLGLAKLTRLDLSYNDLSEIPSAIPHLSGLTVLDLSHNPLGTLPIEIGGMARLAVLHLSDCRLAFLPSEIGGLENLTELDLTGNLLSTLPESLANLETLERLFLHDNPALQLSPYILGADPRKTQDRKFSPAKSILNFHFSRSSKKSRPLNEVKLVLLGRSGSGKTSIVHALRDLPFHEREPATSGVELCDWTLDGSGGPPVTVHVWDFAGQPVTHALHPLFFSPRNLYVLVLAGSGHSGHDEAEYWLRMIESSAKDPEGRQASVIVALNQWNVSGGRPELDRIALRDKYPFIRSFVEMDCKGKKGIPALKSALFRELERMPWVREPFLDEWDAVRQSLTAAGTSHKPLIEEQYRIRCAEHGVTDEGQQDYLAEILHHLGTAPNHRNDPRLPDFFFVNPAWLTKHLYQLLRRAEILAGLLRQSDVDKVLSDEKDETARACLLQVLECFRIAYGGQGKSEGAWMIPHAQPAGAPASAKDFHNAADAIRTRHVYQSVPDDVLPRIIARRHDFIEEAGGQKLQWRHGVILLRNGARALIQVEPQLRSLSITVTGPVQSRHQLAGLCQAEIHELHAEIPDLDPISEIQVNGEWAPYSGAL